MDGYAVELGQLKAGRDALIQLVDGMRQHPVQDMDTPATFGHADLAAAAAEFCARWQRGVENLLDDTATIARDLDDTVTVYRRFDHAAADAIGLGGE